MDLEIQREPAREKTRVLKAIGFLKTSHLSWKRKNALHLYR
jgi:hypothetical protein